MANSTTFNIVLKGIADFKDVASNISTIQKNLNQLKLPTDLKTKFTGIFSELEKESTKYQKYLDSGFKTKGDVTGLEKTGNRIKSLFESLASTMQKINPDMLKNSFNFDTKQFDDLTQKIQKAKQEMQNLMAGNELQGHFQTITDSIKGISNLSKSKAITQFSEAFKVGDLETASQALAKLEQNLGKFKGQNHTDYKGFLDPLVKSFNELSTNTAIQDKQKELQGFVAQLAGLEESQIKQFFQAFEAGKGAVGGMASEWNKFKSGADASASSVFDLNHQMDQLKHRIGYFFGVTNIINLFKRTVKEAINTVKELDAVMTETAVVTDFTVGDMWDKLPQYAAQANALGASIRDLYAATTLYYQQGLQTDAAMSVGVETMKMARIAGMEAADATTAMTAALRGFNMEVNEMNAQRVNDVYSELAAITAADTNQIATAMGKTASIAASANMEFEATAALLAQIIETTQEAPETAGTAMKTIIARFTEVKKLFSEGQLTGEDEEGEAISINKIDDALKSVGISLKDFLNGSKGMHDIFLELASKWDTLDLATQRYIATTAAGSRQQSRFIAMMSNYDRTMELVTAANNSAGASQNQFDKTLESMEAKLQRLKNAWDQFVMGLANNDILKFGVDLLTGFLETVNKLTSALSGGNGLAKSVINLTTVIGALAGGRALSKSIFDGGKMATTLTMGGGKGFSIQRTPIEKNMEDTGKKAGNMFQNAFTRVATGKEQGRSSFGSFFGNQIMHDTGKAIKTSKVDLSKQLADKMRQQADTLKMQQLDIGGDDLTKQAMNLEKMADSLENGGVTVEQASQAFKDAGGNIKDLGNSAPMATKKVKALALDFSAVGMAAMGAGMALSLLGGLFEKLGWEEGAQACQTLGAALTGIGGVVMLLAPMFNNLGMSVSAAGISFVKAGAEGAAAGIGVQIAWWPLLLITAALVVAFAAINSAIKNSPAGKLKTATEELKEQEKTLESLTNQYEELKSQLDSIDEKTSMLDNYIEGTEAWKDQVQALNQEIATLVSDYPEFGAFLKSNNGVLSFDKNSVIDGQTFEDVIDQYSNRVDSATISKMAQSVIVAQQKNQNIAGEIYTPSANLEYTTQEAERMNLAIQDLLVAISEGQISKQDGKLSEIEIRDFLNNYALGALQDDVFRVAREFSEGDYHYNLSNLQSKGREISSNRQEIRGKETIIISENLSKANLTEDSRALLQNIDPSLLRGSWNNFLEENASSVGWVTNAEREAYAKATNRAHVAGTRRKFEVDGEVTKLGQTHIKTTAQNYLAEQDFQEALADFGVKLSQMKTEASKEAFTSLLSDGGSLIDQNMLNQYFDWAKNNTEGTTIDFFEAQTGLELSPEDLKVLGFDTEEAFSDQINKNLANGLKNYIYSKKDLVKILKKTGKAESGIYEALTNAGEKDQLLVQASNALSQIGDSTIQDTALNYLVENIENLDVSALEEINSLVESINWDNPIEAAGKLQNAVNGVNKDVASFAQAIVDANSAKIGAGAQFRQVVNSEEFGELNEEMAKLIEQNGELDASSINEWREECSLLNKMMKQTGITASGMAKALTMLSNEELKLSQMTDAVIAAFSQFDSIDDLLYNTIKTIEDFDPGQDEGAIADFVTSSYETLKEHVEAGEWGNSQNRNIIEFIFGPNALKDGEEYLKDLDYAQAIKDYMSFLEKNQSNMSSAWYDLAKGQFLGKDLGLSAATSGQGVQLASDLELLKHDNGSVELKGFENYSMPDLMDLLATYTGSKQLAEMMFTDLANNSPNVQAYKEAYDYEQGIAAFAENARRGQSTIGVAYGTRRLSGSVLETNGGDWGVLETIMGETKMVDESEIEALMSMYGIQDRQQIVDSLEQYGITRITDLYDDNGQLKSNGDLIQNINDVLGLSGQAWAEGFSQRRYSTSTGELTGYHIDYDELMAGLEGLGIPDSVKQSLAIDMAQSMIDGVEQGVDGATKFLYTTEIGTEVEIPITADMTEAELMEKIDLAEVQAEADILGQAVADAMSSLGIDADGLQEAIDKSTAEAPLEVSVGANLNSDAQKVLQQALSQIEGLTVNVTGVISDTTTADGEHHATGIKNSPTSHLALTGEKGPELVQTADGYYITGQNGPEMAYINKGDTVYTASETRKILKGHKNIGPRYEGGLSGYGDIFKKGGSGGKGSKDDGWETSIDKLYNLLRDIDEELRQRENLERRYNSLLEKIGTNTGDLVKVTRQTLAQLEKERGLQEELIAGRNSQIDDYLKEQSKYNKYAWVEEDEWGDRVLRIDWEAIDAISNEEEGKKVEEYLKQLETWMEDIDGAKDTIADIDDAVREIYERGKDEYFDLEASIRDALEGERQKEIDKLSEINDTINDTNTRLLDSIQDSIDEQRQARDNTKTEEELADKQRRLSYLQMDTSGANALEILELQREIEEGQRDYTDNLIDQKITALQKQNDEAAQQRQDQIDIMQAQLDHYIKSGEVWQDAYELMQSGINSQGIIVGSSLWDVLAGNEDYASKSNLEKLKWAEEINDNVALAMLYLKSGQSTEGLINSGELKQGGKVTFTTSDGTTVTGTLKDNGDIVDDKTGQTYKDVYKNWDGSFRTDEAYISEKYVAPEPEPESAPAPAPAQDPKPAPTWKYIEKYRGPFTDDVYRPQDGGWFIKKWWEDNLGKETNVTYTKKTASVNSIVVGGGGGGAATQRVLLKYASGGLATETGPAWLDGTKARPEYVLNADQTRAFLTLVDVLEGFGRGSVSNSQNSGDNTYDIDINVESIGSDYDVEQLANTVKRLINDDARYRNNNTIGYSR